MSSRWLIVFLKAPRAGFVKTRLAKDVGAERACEIYRELVGVVLKNATALSGRRDAGPLRQAGCPPLQVQLRYTPEDGEEEIKQWCGEEWSMEAQGAGDLGERLHRAFIQSFKEGAESVVIIGSDSPDVRPEDIEQAWDEAARHDVVLGPAMDGGYWLVALSRPQPELFAGISWGSANVFDQTMERARRAGLRVHLLRTLRDIDTLEDWTWWSANSR